MKEATVIEITTFRLNEGVEERAFLQAVEKMQSEFLAKQKGYIRRSLSLSENSLWKDIILRTDRQSMEQTANRAAESKAASPFMSCIDFNSVKMETVSIKAYYE